MTKSSINHLARISLLATLGAAAIQASPHASAATIIDDFESYAVGNIGTSASSTPWRRFGSAVGDHVTVTANTAYILDGTKSARFGLTWPNTSANATASFANSPAPLTNSSQVSVAILSNNTATTTKVGLNISDGVTTWRTANASLAFISGTAQTLTFNLNTTDMILASGSGTLANVMAHVTTIGLRFTNTNSGAPAETITFDALQSYPVPEPASAFLMLGGTLLLTTRRPPLSSSIRLSC